MNVLSCFELWLESYAPKTHIQKYYVLISVLKAQITNYLFYSPRKYAPGRLIRMTKMCMSFFFSCDTFPLGSLSVCCLKAEKNLKWSRWHAEKEAVPFRNIYCQPALWVSSFIMKVEHNILVNFSPPRHKVSFSVLQRALADSVYWRSKMKIKCLRSNKIDK